MESVIQRDLRSPKQLGQFLFCGELGGETSVEKKVRLPSLQSLEKQLEATRASHCLSKPRQVRSTPLLHRVQALPALPKVSSCKAQPVQPFPRTTSTPPKEVKSHSKRFEERLPGYRDEVKRKVAPLGPSGGQKPKAPVPVSPNELQKAHKKPEKPKAAPPVKPTVKRREAPKEPNAAAGVSRVKVAAKTAQREGCRAEEMMNNAMNMAQAKREEEAAERARREAEEKARRDAEEKARREAEEKARCEAEEKARRDAEEKARREAEEKARREAEEKARREAEEKARREAEEKARRDAEEKARHDAEEKAGHAVAEKAREAEEKAQRDAEEKARGDAEKQREAEEKATHAAEDYGEGEEKACHGSMEKIPTEGNKSPGHADQTGEEMITGEDPAKKSDLQGEKAQVAGRNLELGTSLDELEEASQPQQDQPLSEDDRYEEEEFYDDFDSESEVSHTQEVKDSDVASVAVMTADSFATPSAGTDPAHESSESLPVSARDSGSSRS